MDRRRPISAGEIAVLAVLSGATVVSPSSEQASRTYEAAAEFVRDGDERHVWSGETVERARRIHDARGPRKNTG